MCTENEKCNLDDVKNSFQAQMSEEQSKRVLNDFIERIHKVHMVFGIAGQIEARSTALDGIEYEIKLTPHVVDREAAEEGSRKAEAEINEWSGGLIGQLREALQEKEPETNE